MSYVMVDQITTVSKKKLDEHVGRLSDEDISRVNRARGGLLFDRVSALGCHRRPRSAAN